MMSIAPTIFVSTCSIDVLQCGLFNEARSLEEESVYWGAKTELIKDLHSYFIYKKSMDKFYRGFMKDYKPKPRSSFMKGYVGVFLQESPLTLAIMDVLSTHGISSTQLDLIDLLVEMLACVRTTWSNL